MSRALSTFAVRRCGASVAATATAAAAPLSSSVLLRGATRSYITNPESEAKANNPVIGMDYEAEAQEAQRGAAKDATGRPLQPTRAAFFASSGLRLAAVLGSIFLGIAFMYLFKKYSDKKSLASARKSKRLELIAKGLPVPRELLDDDQLTRLEEEEGYSAMEEAAKDLPPELLGFFGMIAANVAAQRLEQEQEERERQEEEAQGLGVAATGFVVPKAPSEAVVAAAQKDALVDQVVSGKHASKVSFG